MKETNKKVYGLLTKAHVKLCAGKSTPVTHSFSTFMPSVLDGLIVRDLDCNTHVYLFP